MQLPPAPPELQQKLDQLEAVDFQVHEVAYVRHGNEWNIIIRGTNDALKTQHWAIPIPNQGESHV